MKALPVSIILFTVLIFAITFNFIFVNQTAQALTDLAEAIPLADDREAELGFAQATLSLGKAGDILLAISTSGNSKNVLAAAKVARALGMRVIALTGEGGGALGALADITLAVPERETFKVQELHLPLYHYLCAAVERAFF